MTPSFSCYRPRPAHSPLEAAALYVLKNARGFFRTRGLSAEQVRSAIARTFALAVPVAAVTRTLQHLAKAAAVEVNNGYFRKAAA